MCSYGSAKPKLLTRKTYPQFAGSPGAPMLLRSRRRNFFLLSRTVWNTLADSESSHYSTSHFWLDAVLEYVCTNIYISSTLSYTLTQPCVCWQIWIRRLHKGGKPFGHDCWWKGECCLWCYRTHFRYRMVNLYLPCHHLFERWTYHILARTCRRWLAPNFEESQLPLLYQVNHNTLP